MPVLVEIPDNFAALVGQTAGELQTHLLEDAAIGAYCRDAVSRSELQVVLGLKTSYELDGLLKERGVEHGSYSGSDLLDDLQRLNIEQGH